MAETSRHANANANANANGCSIKVGTTGTISSLMTRELESMKHMHEASGSSSSKKCQTAPVSVPCGASPRTLQPRRNPPMEPGSGSSNNNNKNSGSNIYKIPLDAQKPRKAPLRNGNRIPMLSNDNTTVSRNKMKDKPDKKGSSYIVEVVDLKCNNPMSSRLRKLGFSKLSESII